MKSLARFLKLFYELWMKLAHAIGRVNTAILLTLFYFIFIGFAKLVTLLARKDLLDIRLGDRPSYWKNREKFVVNRNAFLKPY